MKKPEFKIGAKVVVTTCNGEFVGRVKKYLPSFHGDIDYKVLGPELNCVTSSPKHFNENEVLRRGPTCDTCLTEEDCCFSSLKEVK